MGLWIIIFFSLYGILNGQETVYQQPSVEQCCQDGRDWGLGRRDCAVLPLISSSITCRMIQEQCCDAAVEDMLCTEGISSAKEQAACEIPSLNGEPCSIRTAKMCCDCCVLGMKQGCDLGLSVSQRCQQVAKACCGGEPVKQVESKPGDAGNSLGKDPCEGTSKCSHLCVGNGVCACLEGYNLKPNGYSCEDINECLAGSHHCQQGEQCINTEGSFRCQREASCGTGYELTDSNTCNDIDECSIGTHNCGPGFQCRNTAGSFRCRPRDQCGDGFIQDAVGSCIDINECVSQKSPCQQGHTCLNTVGSYTCQKHSVTCGRGYHLNEDGTGCSDVDECRGLEGACEGHGCVNLLGSFRCECRPGFIFNSIGRVCEDINECRHYPGRLCAHKCENTPGSYQCSCSTGFKLAIDGKSCEDLNECETNPCSQECANVYGSYQCYCRRGFQLSDIDGVTCEDIDECALATGGHVCSYLCTNTPGSFECTCPPTGYTLAPNGRTCQDIDECITGAHTCSETQSCFNIQGGFRCLSFECPPNFRHAAENRCERVPCEHAGECLSLPLRISFYNLTFPTNIPVPADIFRMGPSNSAPGDDVRLAVVGGDGEGFFRAQRLARGGVISLWRPLAEPRDFLLTVEMRLVRYGTVSLYVAKIAVFVTHEQPVPPSSRPPF